MKIYQFTTSILSHWKHQKNVLLKEALCQILLGVQN
ncbi:hypothetical protein CASFOL_016005 [Castilleja foliolosa]|uniref:Ribosomal protein S15 n=1 Tax=Castilleja foliolosa TaxID=1961234 RepID=A0ABD3DG87_9LAMI